ncbi:hypothetical protein CHIBA101_0994 [Actinomyces sp. Chiba101]|nr:hypothetical protein CHIBA101_0994 [Actinomyces sp. Chiba101]GAV94168.1 hypothetical protein ADENT20671_0936 [Actinomyces denticolens]
MDVEVDKVVRWSRLFLLAARTCHGLILGPGEEASAGGEASRGLRRHPGQWLRPVERRRGPINEAAA